MVTEGETVSRPDTVITDDGYKVVGWCVVENCTIENEYSFTDSLKGNLVLHARWEIESYSINYELDGGTNAPENLTTYNVNSGDIVFAAPTKEGATFDGWFYDQEFTNPATQIGAGSTGDKKIYAKWTNATFIVQYLSGNTIYATAKNDTKLYGDTIQLKGALEEFVHGGCTQDGWSKVDYGQDGYGVDYALGADYAANENLKVFPHWTCNTYKITYEIYGMSVTNRNDSTYTGPAKMTLENAFDPAKKYFFMDNWYKEPTFKTAIRDIQNIDADLTLYARWYNKITYKPGSNATGKAFEEKKYFDITYTITTATNKFTRANYTLDGWSTTNGGAKVYELGETYTTNENLTLYPHWVENRDSVQYGAVKIYTYASDGHKEAVIDGNSEEETNIPEDIEVDAVTFDRTFPVGNRSTIVLPFDIAVANTHGGKFNVLSSISGDFKTITLGEKSSQLYAYEPYVMLADQSTLTFDGPVTLKKTVTNDKPVGDSDWYFKAALEKIVFGEREDLYGRAYGFAGVSVEGFSAGQFVKAGKKAWVGPMKGYLVYTGELNGSASKSAVGAGLAGELPDEINVVVQDEQGNIVERGVMNTRTGEFRMDRWYDLQGRKLNRKPQTQGTYYHNGSRVIVK